MPAYSVASITTMADLQALRPDWEHLFHASATRNIFLHPVLLISWAQHYIREDQLDVLVVRDPANNLVGLAPFYRRRFHIAPGLAVTSIQLLASVAHGGLIELTQILAKPGLERHVLSAVMQHYGRHAAEWDWLELIVPPEQGWFDPQWLPKDGPGQGSFVLHKGTRTCVVLSMPPSWDDLRTSLKRNIKESLRHGTNSLKREDHAWHVKVPSDIATLPSAVDQLMHLHRLRATINGRVRHADYLARRTDRGFLRTVAVRGFEAGVLTPYVMCVDGNAVAAHLVFHANRTTFFSLSGFDPQWWSYNVGTTLMAECLRTAVLRGDTLANLSPGPHVAKLRWSEQLELHQEFLIVNGRSRSQFLFSVYWHLRTAAMIRRERHRHERV